MDLIIYCAGAISGHEYQECVNQFDIRIKKLKEFGYSVLYPLLGKGYLRNELCMRSEGYTDQPLSTNHAIVQADFWRVDNCHILYADFTNACDRVSIGTVSEISRAFSKNKLVITVLPKENIHRHAFILEMSSIIFETNEEALAYLYQYSEVMKGYKD